MRTPIIAANWKMHKTAAEAVAFAEKLKPLVMDVGNVDMVVAPPFTALEPLGRALAGSPVALAAQNVHPAAQGAFTGEISIPMLSDLGCRYVIVGHSERRAIFGETSAFVAQKAVAVQEAGLTPILCVGEALDDREAGRTNDVLGSQLDASLAGTRPDLVIAYEPVWAIGTGRTATPEIAQEAHAFIRERLNAIYSPRDSDAIRIQYGGSVKPDNTAELLSQPDVDGALVGGASLEAKDFLPIIRATVD